MKKIILLFLVLIMLFLFGSCKETNVAGKPCYIPFNGEQDFSETMKREVEVYDENGYYHLYKWGDNLPKNTNIRVIQTGTLIKPIHTFDGMSMFLSCEDETFGSLSMEIMYCITYKTGGFENFEEQTYGRYNLKIRCEDLTENMQRVDYEGVYLTGSYVVLFTQHVSITSKAYINGYGKEDFISCMANILDSKQELTL